MLEFYQAVRALDADSRNLAVTVIDGEFMGRKLLVSDQKVIWESDLIQDSRKILSEETVEELTEESDGQNVLFKQEIARLSEQVKDGGVYTVGSVHVFCEPLCREQKMVICGAGHVSIPVIRMGIMLSFHVTVLEDRPKFADDARRAGASCVICKPFEEGLSQIKGDADTYFVIVTRGHRYDIVCLESIAKKKHAYIGMIGSKRRTAIVKDTIIKNGADPKVVQSVYTPIGLAIGAKTPEEIAVAIVAQIIQVKNERPCGGFSTELLDAVLDEKRLQEPKVMATIIRRMGSAPREAGAKMLILADGSSIGTIGGGCVEADLLQKALLMLREGKRKMELYHADLSESAAEEDGMVCGGAVDVLLECIEAV